MSVDHLSSKSAAALVLVALAASCVDEEGGEVVAASAAELGAPIRVCNLVPAPLPRVAATASSVESPALAPAFAIDGDPATRWSSALSDPQWLRVDLGAVRYIDTVTLTWETASSQRYELSVSHDDVHWKVVKVVGYNPPGTQQVSHTGLNARGRYLRLDSSERNTEWGVSLHDVSVAGDADGACTQPGALRLDAVHSGKALDAKDWSTADGGGIQQWAYGGGQRNQKWSVSHVGFDDQLQKLYEIRSVHSGKCLDVTDASTADRAPLQQWTCHGGANQRFALRATGPYYQIVAAHSGKCLDVEAAAPANGARVVQWPCHTGDNQKWALLDPQDLETDSESCGRAGHSCFGGACVSGVCQPALVSTAFQCATTMTASEQHVFVGDAGNLHRFDRDGYNRTTLVASNLYDFIGDLVRSDNQLFYRGTSQLKRLTLGEAAPVTLLSGDLYQLSVNATRVFGHQAGEQRFLGVDRSGGQVSVVADLPGEYPMWSAATDAHLYYVVGSSEGTKVVRVELASGEKRVVNDPTESVFGLTTYDGTAYWSYRTAAGQSGIRRLASAGWASVEEAVLPVQAPGSVGNPLVDATGIYHSVYDGVSGAPSHYYRTPHDELGRRELVTTGASPYASTNTAMTSDSIFWMSTCHRYGGGWLYRLAKP